MGSRAATTLPPPFRRRPPRAPRLATRPRFLHRRLTFSLPRQGRRAVIFNLLLGPIHTIEYLCSGSLLLTTNTLNQVSSPLEATHLPTFKIPITSTVAWNKQLTYGKLYTREFSFDTLETTLGYLRPHNVVAIRVFRPSSSASSHFYVLTFLSPTPSKLQVGYSIYTIDRYASQPLRCYHCWRFRHSAAQCRSRAFCSFCCSSSLHIKYAVTATAPKCINCAGSHPSNSATCPIFAYEQEICHVQASARISFLHARSRVAESRAKRPNTPLPPEDKIPHITSLPSLPRPLLQHSPHL